MATGAKSVGVRVQMLFESSGCVSEAYVTIDDVNVDETTSEDTSINVDSSLDLWGVDQDFLTLDHYEGGVATKVILDKGKSITTLDGSDTSATDNIIVTMNIDDD